ncbi:MAG: hypothetical protein ABR606_00910 [Vicinamibacterales bacterium]
MRISRLIPAVALVAAAACGDSTPTTPTPVPPPALGPRSGTWLGTLADRVNGTGTVTVQLEDRPLDGSRSLLSGTWTASFPLVARVDGGTVGGNGTDATVSVVLSPSTRPACTPPMFLSSLTGSFTLTLEGTGGRMTGSSLYAACDGGVSGRAELTKQ